MRPHDVEDILTNGCLLVRGRNNTDAIRKTRHVNHQGCDRKWPGVMLARMRSVARRHDEDRHAQFGHGRRVS